MSLVLEKKSLRKLKDFESDSAWYRTHYQKLKSKYRGKYILVKNGKVVDYDTDHKRLLLRVRKKYGQTGSFVIRPVSDRNVHPAT